MNTNLKSLGMGLGLAVFASFGVGCGTSPLGPSELSGDASALVTSAGATEATTAGLGKGVFVPPPPPQCHTANEDGGLAIWISGKPSNSVRIESNARVPEPGCPRLEWSSDAAIRLTSIEAPRGGNQVVTATLAGTTRFRRSITVTAVDAAGQKASVTF